METRSQEAEKRALEVDRRMNEKLIELGQRQEMLHKQTLEQRQEMRSQTAKTDARMDEMMQAILALSLQNQAKEGEEKLKTRVGDEGVVIAGNDKNEWGRATRFEFPKFDGEGFDGWIMRAEYFFEVARITEIERVRIAALHLEGKALQWHIGYISLQGEKTYGDWENYTKSLAARFGANAFEDPLADLRNLKQTSSLQVYMDAFDELYPRTSIREDQALSFFLSGLVDELEMPVRMFKPKSLADAYALAKLQDLTVKAMQNRPRTGQSSSSGVSGYNSGNKSLSVTTSHYKPPVSMNNSRDNGRGNITARPGARLSSKEVEERRSKGLCFWCDEKYTPNHHCPKRKAFVLHMVDEESVEEAEEEGEEGEEGEDSTAELQLSLHAMWGIEGAQIMRIRGLCQKRVLRILVDTRSTHNFLSTQIADKVKGEWIQVMPAAVEVANGQQLECTRKGREFEWEMQGAKFQTEVHIIPLETYDLTLGVKWLSTLGNISWNFKTLQMRFKLHGKLTTLAGEGWSAKEKYLNCLTLTLQQEESEEGSRDEIKLSKLVSEVDRGILLACYGMQKEELWPELSVPLTEFAEVFEEPTGLPPPRQHDHKIQLKEGA